MCFVLSLVKYQIQGTLRSQGSLRCCYLVRIRYLPATVLYCLEKCSSSSNTPHRHKSQKLILALSGDAVFQKGNSELLLFTRALPSSANPQKCRTSFVTVEVHAAGGLVIALGKISAGPQLWLKAEHFYWSLVLVEISDKQRTEPAEWTLLIRWILIHLRLHENEYWCSAMAFLHLTHQQPSGGYKLAVQGMVLINKC